jgi:hypothetical protein
LVSGLIEPGETRRGKAFLEVEEAIARRPPSPPAGLDAHDGFLPLRTRRIRIAKHRKRAAFRSLIFGVTQDQTKPLKSKETAPQLIENRSKLDIYPRLNLTAGDDGQIIDP